MDEIALPECPEKPLPSDCCNSGCSPCIMDVYENQVRQWEEKCRLLKSGAVVNEVEKPDYFPALQKTKYSKFMLSSIINLTNDTNLYRFQAINAVQGTELGLKNLCGGRKFQLSFEPTQYFILQGHEIFDGVEKHFTRAYTPVSDKNLALSGSFDVIIKLYPGGKMSQYLQKLTCGDFTLWRGPYGEFIYKPNTFKHILMLCAGTGIAPMYSLAQKIVQDEEDETIIKMLFCCKNETSIILRKEIHALQSFWNFTAHIYLAHSAEANFRSFYGETLKTARLSEDTISLELRAMNSRDMIVLICGNDHFCKEMELILRNCCVNPRSVHIF